MIINVAGQSIPANQEAHTGARVLPQGVIGKIITVRMTDPSNQWGSVVGNVQRWGLQTSTDGGSTFSWGPIWQGDPGIASSWIAFGSQTKDGGLPFLSVSSDNTLNQAGDLVRLAIQVDTVITLGAQIVIN